MSKQTSSTPHRGRHARAARLWLLLGAILACTLSVSAQEPVPVDSLAFEGLERVDPDLVRESIRVRVGETAHAYQITQSVRSLYALGLFDQVEARLHDGGRTLIFIFAERPRVTEVSFTGNKFFNVEDLRDYEGVRVGGVLKRSGLARLRRSIEEAYNDEGFADARVVPQAGEDLTGEGVQVRVEIDEGKRGKIHRILFEGNESFEAKKLRGEIKLKPKGFLRKGRFHREKAEEDVERLRAFYQNNGFKDAQVTLQDPVFGAEGEGGEVTFRIEEGTRYYFGEPSFVGSDVFEDARLQDSPLFLKGDPYSQEKVDETLATLYNMYTERGYLVELRIEPVTAVREDSVWVTYDIHEGNPSHVGEIKIVGNTRTKERVIRRELKLFPGDLLRRSLLLRSQRDIFNTGYFEDVQVEFDPAEEAGEVDVTFRVAEKSSATANGGVGYSSQVGLTGFVKFGHNNLMGNGQSLMVEVERGSRREYYDLSFTEPWVFGRPISAGIDLYNTQNYREVYAGESYDASYWHQVRGGGVRLGFPWIFRFPDYTRMSLGYSFSETRYRDYDSLPEDTQKQLLLGDGSRSRFYVTLYRNSVDNPFHPTLGTRTTLRNEFNGGLLGGDMDYYRITFDHRQYF